MKLIVKFKSHFFAASVDAIVGLINCGLIICVEFRICVVIWVSVKFGVAVF